MREGLFRMTGTDPLVNPIVHGDGVGYYAYVRAPLIEQNLDFTEDYRRANLLRASRACIHSGKRASRTAGAVSGLKQCIIQSNGGLFADRLDKDQVRQ